MSLPRLIIRIAVFTFACYTLSFAQRLPREEWGAPAVVVSRAEGKWIIAGRKNKVALNESDLALSVQAGPANWAMVPSSTKDMLVRSRGEEFHLRLADARKIEIEPYDTGFKTGVKISLAEWRHNGLLNKGAELDLRLFLTVCLEGKDDELVFDVAAGERETILRRLDWPTALDAREVDHTLLSNGRGNLLPRNWPKEFYPIRTITPEGKVSPTDKSVVQSNVIESWSMSWWGFQKGRSAMMVIVETPNDAAYQFRHPAGGPTVISPRWRATLGRFGYLRTARMCFVADGNYVDLAKRYRRYAMDTGLFVSLKEKIARTPAVKDLIGTPLTRLSILRNLKPDSARYDQKNPDWTIPYADISSPLGPAKCVTVPLFNLVYHDAIITPYRTGDMQNILYGLLNGGLPQVGDLKTDLEKNLALIRQMAALHERLALIEMTKHEFLDKNYRKERTTFADGTTVTVDWDANTFEISPELKASR